MNLNWLYPSRCAVCDGVLKRDEYGCCTRCVAKKYEIKGSICYRCGKPLLSAAEEYCQDCATHRKHFTFNRAVFTYAEEIQQSLMRFKYENRGEYAAYFAHKIVERYGEVILSWNADALVPVPVHRKKQRRRGYNQAELLAVEVGKRLQLPVLSDTLIRTQQTTAQKELTPIQRLENLENAFQFGQDGVKLEKVIVVDDIYTTGATLEACSRVLLRAGVQEVYGITVAVGEGY